MQISRKETIISASPIKLTTLNRTTLTLANCMYCNYCPGYCCYRLEGSMLLITATDITRLARYFHVSDGEVRRRYMENRYTFRVKDDGACIFQASDRMVRRCSVHPARPDQCRRFPYGNPCPYMEREDLLEQIQPRVEQSLGLRRSAD